MKISKKLIKVKHTIRRCAKEYDSEFEVFTDNDANNNGYYYLHFKPRGGSSSVEDTIWILNKGKIRYCVPTSSDWKTVIWIPFDQKLNYLIHSEKEVYLIKQYE